MQLLDLPSEVLHSIFTFAIWDRGVKKALRLSLVSKAFSLEFEPALFASRILDTQIYNVSSSHIWHAYCTYRVNTFADDIMSPATIIRLCAEAIFKENVSSKETLYSIKYALCALSIHSNHIGPHIFHLEWKEKMRFDVHLLAAASYLNCTPIVERIIASRVYKESSVFGSPIDAAARQGHDSIVQKLFSSKTKPENFSDDRSIQAVQNATTGRYLDVLDLILEPQWANTPPSPFNQRYVEPLINTLSRKDPTVFERVVYDLTIDPPPSYHPASKFFPEDHLTRVLHHAALIGNLSLVVYLLESGTVPTVLEIKDESTDILCTAVRGGHSQVVKALLEAGANPNPGYSTTKYWRGDPLAQAVRFGSRTIAQILLDYGADINGGHPLPIYYAAQQEDNKMYHFLLQRGARSPWGG